MRMQPRDPIADLKTGKPTWPWVKWFEELKAAIGTGGSGTPGPPGPPGHDGSSEPWPVRPAFYVAGKPSAGQELLAYTAEATFVFPSNFGGAFGGLDILPDATTVINCYKNNVLCGTVTISTSGVFTFATTSGAIVSFNAGDRFTVKGAAVQNATLSGVNMTFVGIRSASVPSSQVFPFLNDRGNYDNAATYQPWDVAYYNGSTYRCILPSTGHLPTDTTYWLPVALKGADGASGGVQVSDDIGGTTNHPNVVGLRGKALDTSVATPTDKQVVQYDSASGKYKAATLAGGVEAYYSGSSSSSSLGTAPTTPAAIANMTVTVAASSSVRQFSVNAVVSWATSSHGMRVSLLVDGTRVFPTTVAQDGINPSVTGDGLYNGQVSGVVVSIPGDNATHTIAMAWSAQTSTTGFTIYDRWITAVKVG